MSSTQILPFLFVTVREILQYMEHSGSVVPSVRKYEFLKTLHLLLGLLFHIQAKAAEGELQNCSNSVQKLV